MNQRASCTFFVFYLVQSVSEPYEVHVFIASILEMEKLKYSTEVKQLAPDVEGKLECRQLGNKNCSPDHCALLPLWSLERTQNTDSSKIGEQELMGNIIDMYMYSCEGETSTHLITCVFSIKQKVITPVDD